MLAIATIGMLSATTLSAGLLLAFTPYLMRRNECFAVTIPAFAQNDPRLAYLKKRYAVIMAIITALSTIASLAAGAFLVANEEALGVTILCTALLVPIAASFALMLHNRQKVAALKHAEGWQAKGSHAAVVTAEEDLPRALPLVWNLLYIPVVLATIALGLALYPSMPDMLPMHADFEGNVTITPPRHLEAPLDFPY